MCVAACVSVVGAASGGRSAIMSRSSNEKPTPTASPDMSRGTNRSKSVPVGTGVSSCMRPAGVAAAPDGVSTESSSGSTPISAARSNVSSRAGSSGRSMPDGSTRKSGTVSSDGAETIARKPGGVTSSSAASAVKPRVGAALAEFGASMACRIASISAFCGSAASTREYHRCASAESCSVRAMSPRWRSAIRFSSSSSTEVVNTSRAASRSPLSKYARPSTMWPLMWPGCDGRCSRQSAIARSSSCAMRYSFASGTK